MKFNKIIPAIAALGMLFAAIQANASGLEYDSCENYYTTYYGIDMAANNIVSHGSDTHAAPREQQEISPIEISFYSDPRNYYNW